MYLIRILLLFFVLVFASSAIARDVIRSAVSPYLINGLHSKYLRNIAQHMDMEVEITPMPFARRIRALRSGEIDIMVGMRHEKDEQDEIVYIYPSYETLRHTFFVLKKKLPRLQSFEDLKTLNIGVTIHALYFDRFNQQADLAMVSTESLDQKIELLLKGRIDTFIHFEESTLPKLRKMGLSDVVVFADYQPTECNKYHLTVSQNSPMIKKISLFEMAVKKALENDEFTRIRQAHYDQ